MITSPLIRVVPIDKIPAGSHLDALVAVNVMGWQEDQVDAYGPLFCPSTDLTAAMRVVGQLEQRERVVELRYSSEDRQWHCRVDGVTKIAQTATLAICRAALKAAAEPNPRTTHADAPAT